MTTLPDLAHVPDAVRRRKRRMMFHLRFPTHSGICETLEGKVNFQADDTIVTGSAAETWPLERRKFLASYAPAGATPSGQDGDYFTLLKQARAIRLGAPLAVPAGAANNPITGKAGDWLLQYDDASYGIVRDELFKLQFEVSEID